MPKPLRVLMLEDRPADAELSVIALRENGYAPEFRRVETEQEFLAALQDPYDLILADYALPQFDAVAALKLLQSRDVDIPLIIVSGTVGEDVAVEAMRLGASDYIMKDRQTRLGEAVRQALENKHLRESERQAKTAFLQAKNELEQRVNERTGELSAANDRLQKEIADRLLAEEEVRKLNHELRERLQAYERLVEELEQSKTELQEKIEDLEKFEQVVVGRELKMIALEKELERHKSLSPPFPKT